MTTDGHLPFRITTFQSPLPSGGVGGGLEVGGGCEVGCLYCTVAVLQFQNRWCGMAEMNTISIFIYRYRVIFWFWGRPRLELQRCNAATASEDNMLQRLAGKVADVHAGCNRGDYKADSERDFNRRRGVNTCEADDAVFVFVVVFGCSLRSLKYFPPRILCNRPVVS